MVKVNLTKKELQFIVIYLRVFRAPEDSKDCNKENAMADSLADKLRDYY